MFVQDPSFWVDHIHRDDREWVMEYSSKAIREGRKHEFEYRMIHANGSIVWLRNIVNIIVENGVPNRLIGIATDISERKRMEGERDQLNVRLMRAEERERFAVARELHDGIGQHLAVLNLKLAALAKTLKDKTEQRTLKDISTGLQSAATEVQRISHGLHSPTLELLGLRAALVQQCRDFATVSAAEVMYSIPELPQGIHPDISHSLYRILQECFRNIEKHSRAKTIVVEVTTRESNICLKVRDDGVGFDTAVQSEGLGHASIRERMRLVGGEVKLRSAPGKGTEIIATSPLIPSSPMPPRLI
jgi:two-component system NarL family sensor kinase